MRAHTYPVAAALAVVVAVLFLALSGPALALDAASVEALKKRYETAVATELDRKIAPGVSVAWVVDGMTVHAAGYGMADAEHGTPASADTIYRAGSISKLFNAVAAMQLVEQSKLDLDAPIETALPEFRIAVPFAGAGPITVRQLLCHRSGMIREAPVGGYLDNSQPSVTATIASVAACALVNPPNSKTRYSNVGPTIVGRALEVVTSIPFAEYQDRFVLGPLGMKSSTWLMSDALRPRLARGLMRVADGKGGYAFQAAPEFELGTLPAGNLYTTATDLARFATFVMGGSAAEAVPPILRRESLEKMLVPQLTEEPVGYGLGFGVNRYRNHKTVQHSGAVYGFTTSIVVLPEERIGVIVLSNADIAMGPVKRLSEAALDLLLEAVRGEAPTAPPARVEIPTEMLGAFAGEYQSPSYWAKLQVEGASLRGELSGQPIELVPVEPTRFLAEGRMMVRSPFEFEKAADGVVTGFTAAGQRFERVDPAKAPAAPLGWQAFVGSYGHPFIPLVISVRNGHLHALAENEYDYRLAPVNRVTFRLPVGMYDDEHIVFQTDAGGKVLGVVMANMYLPRRSD